MPAASDANMNASETPKGPISTGHSSYENRNSIPFPSSSKQPSPAIPESTSTSSNQTSSDKLSALPAQHSPALGRLRSPNRLARRSIDASGGSLPSFDSPSSLHALHHLPGQTRASESEGSISRETPQRRGSLDSDRRSLPATLQSIKYAIAARHVRRTSQSATRSPSPLSGEGSLQGGQTPQQLPPSDLRYSHTRNLSPQPGKEAHTPTSRSPSQSRAASPLRRLQWAIHRAHVREDPFVPVDPFKPSLFGIGKRGQSSDCPSPREPRSDESKDDKDDDVWVGCLPLPVLSPQEKARAKKKEHCWRKFASDTQIFLTDTLPRQAYLILLLGLPAIYWSRVARVFEDAELSRPDVQRMIDACAPSREGGSDEQGAGGTLRGHVLPHRRTVLLPFPEEWNPPYVSPALVRFKHSWELFVDSLLREWKTLNLVSALLCTAILTMFQVQDAEDDPVTRTAALFGLIFALMSLSYGCVYIVQFGTMRSMDRASRWAEEAQKTKTAIMWNIWVLLAAPAIWLAWSMIAFCVSILSYVWRTGSVADQNPPSPLTDTQALGVRVALSAVFALGLLQFAMIVHTFRSYHGARRVREDQVHRGRERERREQGATEARRGDRDSRVGSSSVVGLGLTGIDENLATPALAGVVATAQEQAENEKMEYLSAEKGRRMGRISPKL